MKLHGLMMRSGCITSRKDDDMFKICIIAVLSVSMTVYVAVIISADSIIIKVILTIAVIICIRAIQQIWGFK